MLSPPPRYPVVLSIMAAVLTLGMKSAAYYLTGSVGLLSDAAESLVNLLAACTAYLSLWFAARPVDSSHTYGHEKIEYFSCGLEGALILSAAVGIIWYAVQRLIAPQPLEALGIGTAISLVASLINLGVAQVLLRVGRASHSIVLEADGKHLMTDVWTSVGVIGGLVVVWLAPGWAILDPLLAIVMALNILWTAYDLLMRSFNGLMDHALPEKEQAAVREAIESCLVPPMHYHALRTRQAGARRFVDFHLLVPGIWSVRVAHKLTEQVEEAVKKVLPGWTEVTVHIEPLEDQASWEDSALIAVEQARQQEKA